jgi:hypothetical protein
MNSLNSVGYARRTLLVTGVGMFIAFLLLAPFAGFAAGSVTIKTDKNVYPSGTNVIHITGNVTPPPASSGTFVAVSITGPTGGTVDANQFAVSTSGSYNGTFTTGGPSYASVGTYTISANYNGATASALIQYGNASSSTTGGSNGTTTTIFSIVTSIISTAVTTTIVQSPVTTTIVSQGSPGVTTTVVNNVQTTTTVSATGGSDSTALAVGAVGLIIAIIAIVLAVMTMRKK